MEIGEIIQDSFKYPLGNVSALIIYMVLGIIAAIAIGGTVVGVAFGIKADSVLATGIIGIVGIIVSFIILLLITGYELDIVKYGIVRSYDAPKIDFAKQVTNGVKLVIVDIIYFLIPSIITFILYLFPKNWILYIIALILFIIFALAAFMAKCRLANSEDLNDALNISEAIEDISRVGLVKMIAVVAIVTVISFIITFIIAFISSQNGVIGYIGDVLLGIFGVYMVFVTSRATGLLYSDA